MDIKIFFKIMKLTIIKIRNYDHGFINHTESLVFLPCNHPSRVKLHNSSVKSHDKDTPL